MTVKELIKKLEKCDQNAEVLIHVYADIEYGDYKIDSVDPDMGGFNVVNNRKLKHEKEGVLLEGGDKRVWMEYKNGED